MSRLAEEIAEKHKLTGIHVGRYDESIIAALEEMKERCAREADYFAKHSITANKIAARIRSL